MGKYGYSGLAIFSLMGVLVAFQNCGTGKSPNFSKEMFKVEGLNSSLDVLSGIDGQLVVLDNKEPSVSDALSSDDAASDSSDSSQSSSSSTNSSSDSKNSSSPSANSSSNDSKNKKNDSSNAAAGSSSGNDVSDADGSDDGSDSANSGNAGSASGSDVSSSDPDSSSQGPMTFVCILEGNGKSQRLGFDVTDRSLDAVGHTPSTVCLSENACLNIVSKFLNVKGPEKRGYCKHNSENSQVIFLEDDKIEALLSR